MDERAQIADAIEQFIKMWGSGTYLADKRGRMVGEELSRLDPLTATVDEVNEIIGNDLWVHPLACSECGERSWKILEIGEPPDHESRTAYLCHSCLTEGANYCERGG